MSTRRLTLLIPLTIALSSCGGQSDPPPATAYDQQTTIGVNTILTDTLDAANVDYSTCTFSIVTTVSNGVISDFDLDTGEFTYTPDSNFVGIDDFFWEVDDQWGDSNVAEYTIGVGVSAGIQNGVRLRIARR